MSKGNTLGERLKLLVKEKGLAQQDIATALGINSVTFSGYVINKREPSFDKLKQFAAYFDVSIDFLLGYSDIKEPYLRHLSAELNDFVRDHDNLAYIELAKDIKARTHSIEDKKQA